MFHVSYGRHTAEGDTRHSQEAVHTAVERSGAVVGVPLRSLDCTAIPTELVPASAAPVFAALLPS